VIRIMRPALEPLSYRAMPTRGLVGPAGLEPTTSRVSDECSHPVSYEPAEDGGVEPRGLATATSFHRAGPWKGSCRAGGPSSRSSTFPGSGEERGGPDPHRPYGHPLSKRRLPPGRFSFRGWRRTRSAGRYPTFAFQTKPARLSGSPSARGRWATRKPTHRYVAPASNGARPACPVHLPHDQLVRSEGVEPSRLAALTSEASVSA
jgi:hypothetical protein